MGTAFRDYSTVTEAPGDALRQEAIDMLWTRYAFAAQWCAGRRVLEVACGPGQGLGLLAAVASGVVGGDYTERLLRFARAHYGSRVPVVRLDAHELPFASGSFDVVLLYEAIYYLRAPATFLAECRRLLRPGGVLIVCSANRLVRGFNPSPQSVRYFSAPELRALLEAHGFAVDMYGAFAAEPSSPRDRLILIIKRAAVFLRLVPKTMKGKALLKRLFFGRTLPAPDELREGMGTYVTPVRLPPGASDDYHRVLFATAEAP